MILSALLLTLDKYSSWRVGRVVPMIRSVVRTDSMQRTDSMMAEDLYQQFLWQVELPQLAKEVQPLLGLFHNGVYVIVEMSMRLGDGGPQEPE